MADWPAFFKGLNNASNRLNKDDQALQPAESDEIQAVDRIDRNPSGWMSVIWNSVWSNNRFAFARRAPGNSIFCKNVHIAGGSEHGRPAA